MGFNKAGGYDTDVYDSDRFSGYANSIGPEDDDEPMTGRKSSSQNAKPKKHTGGIREEYLDKSNDSSNVIALLTIISLYILSNLFLFIDNKSLFFKNIHTFCLMYIYIYIYI